MDIKILFRKCIIFKNNSFIQRNEQTDQIPIRFVAAYDKIVGDDIHFCGETQEFISTISKYLNDWSIVIKSLKDQGNFVNNSWTGITGAIAYDSGDVSMTPATRILTSDGMKLVDFSPPTGIGQSLAILKSKFENKYNSFSATCNAFDIYIWLLILLTCLSLLLINIRKRFGRTNDLVFFICQVLFGQSITSAREIKKLPLLFAWILMVAILVYHYKSLVLSNLISKTPSSINSLIDLVGRKDIEPIAFEHGSAVKMICSSNVKKLDQLCKQLKLIDSYKMEDFIKIIQRKALIIGARTWIDRIVMMYPGLMLHAVRETAFFRSPRFIYNKKLNQIVKKRIDRAIYSIVESGLSEVWYAEGRPFSLNFKSGFEIEKTSLGFSMMKGTLIIYLILILFCIFAFCFEFIYSFHNIKTKKKIWKSDY